MAAAYATTQKLLIAASLNQPTLLGGKPDAFAGLLTAQQRTEFLQGLNTKGTSKAGVALSTRMWVSSFAPGSARHALGEQGHVARPAKAS